MKSQAFLLLVFSVVGIYGWSPVPIPPSRTAGITKLSLKSNHDLSYDNPISKLKASGKAIATTSRRSHLKRIFASSFGCLGGLILTENASAAVDCMNDCVKNCKIIAPNDPAYCQENCKGYCSQDDRTDGLSGSVSSDGGEKGILGINTVVKGKDKPPSISIPGLDFTSGKGKKLIGY
eukprot:CAMPEP_0194276622 /NCGR_PEP_ID=MMETSP0169-20130528/9163_1 /TAXON_ID=218684 /ORGANISM="Corethron pennatum, Strain L29A3" /LENGTH=177 /DNA_ID=CAMNT_0039020379 /DNA_START=100 /DNA_END=633 /DNA_ORIENTATION=-